MATLLQATMLQQSNFPQIHMTHYAILLLVARNMYSVYVHVCVCVVICQKLHHNFGIV